MDKELFFKKNPTSFPVVSKNFMFVYLYMHFFVSFFLYFFWHFRQVHFIGALAIRPSTTHWRSSIAKWYQSKHSHSSNQTGKKCPGPMIFSWCCRPTTLLAKPKGCGESELVLTSPQERLRFNYFHSRHGRVSLPNFQLAEEAVFIHFRKGKKNRF